MQIKTKIKKETILIDVPDFEYWIRRFDQEKSEFWKDADNLEMELSRQYTKAYKNLDKELRAYVSRNGIDGVMDYSQKRIIWLIKELKPHVDELYQNEEKLLFEHLFETFKANYLKTSFAIASSIKVYPFINEPTESVIKTALSFPWSGENFSSRIYQNKNKMILQLRQELTQGFIRGDSISDISKGVSNRVNISFKNAKRLVQTETGAVLTESNKIAYKDFGLERYQYLATLDDRTSDLCQNLDDTKHYLDEMAIGVNAPPMHANCRSTTIPYFDNNTGNRIAKNIETGKAEYVPSTVNYKTWYNKYTEVVK